MGPTHIAEPASGLLAMALESNGIHVTPALASSSGKNADALDKGPFEA